MIVIILVNITRKVMKKIHTIHKVFTHNVMECNDYIIVCVTS